MRQEDCVEPRYLSYKSAVIYTGISEAKLRELKSSGRIKPVKVEGRILFDRFDIDKYMSSLKVEGSKKAEKNEINPDVDVDEQLEQLYGA